MNTTISDGEAVMRKNLRAKEVQRKYEIRKKLRDKIELTVVNNPISLIKQNIESLTDWILNVFVSELQSPAYYPMENIKTVMGLTPDQIFKLQSFYEASTGKRAVDI